MSNFADSMSASLADLVDFLSCLHVKHALRVPHISYVPAV
jgi:hypothetical protein